MATLNNWTVKGKHYLKPIENVAKHNEDLRKKKEEEKVGWEKMMREVDPSASNERRTALVFRLLEEKGKMDAQIAKKKEEKEFTGKPNMSKTLKNWRTYQYDHPGRWMKPVLQDKEMWSCCSSTIKESRGCQATVKDKMAWQFL